MTAGSSMDVASGDTSVKLPSDLTDKLLEGFVKSLAVQFTERLQEQRENEKAEEEKKIADSKQKEEDAKNKGKDESTPEKISPENMETSVCKIDSIMDKNYSREFVPWAENRGRKRNDDEDVTDDYGKWVLVLRRVFDEGEDLRKAKLDVKSPFIKKIVKDVCQEGAMETERASVHWPHDGMFRHREEIREAAQKEGELATKHVAVLLALVEKEFASKIRDINDMFPRGVSSWEVLREIFWPGDVLVTRVRNHPRAYRLRNVYYRENCQQKWLEINAEYIDYDGKDFGTCVETFTISQYPGVQYIEQLSIFPLKYSSRKDEFTAPLLKRGKHFASLTGQCYRSHAGVGRTLCLGKKTSINSRIMVDTTTFNRINASSEITVNSNTLKAEIEANGGKLTDEHLWLCNYEIPAFSFMDKNFYMVDVDNITEIEWKDNVFEKLVLPSSHKELVRVLVENHTSKHQFDDFVEGKGKGLVAVLHGPPGVGKTMTAEAVADHTRRPLYIVTSGELGSNPSCMDTELTRVLDLAKTWNAVLLLDEADVFLEQRTTHDLIRNSLVSIFLRQLEYYQGILFLTTNRVGTFDEAFHSRIHVSLHYHDLTPDARKEIWKNFAATMEDHIDLSDADYAELSQTKLNGRQIKNMVKTAQALAHDKGDKIRMQHMKVVLGVMTSFDEAFTKKESDVEK